MKKTICCLLIGMLCLFMFVSCGTQGEGDFGENSGDNSNSQGSEFDILKEIANANTNEKLIEKHNKVAYRSTYTYADGTIESAYYYMDADRYVFESEDFIYIDEDGDVYGFEGTEKKAFRNLFVENYYEDYVKNNTVVSNFAYFGDIEQIISQEEKDGMITVSTMTVDADVVKEFTTAYLYAEGAVTGIESVYEVEAETYELISMKLSAVLTDGTKAQSYEQIRVSNPETYVVDEQLTEIINAEDKRTAMVIAHPGTEQEKTYSQTIAKGHIISMYLPEDGEQLLYTDVECTTVYEGGSDLNADLTVYYK